MVERGDFWDDSICFDAAIDGLLLQQDHPLHDSTFLDQHALGTFNLAASPRKAKRRRPNAVKDELATLRRTFDDLTRQLQALTDVHSTTTPLKHAMAIWAAAARHERIEARRAKDENHALRTAVNDRAESIEHLRRIFLKKINRFTSNLMPFLSDHLWRQFHLPVDPVHRIAAIHAISDRQRRRHVQILIQAGILDQETDLYAATPITLADNRPGLQVINHVNLPIPHHVAATACWDAVGGGPRRPPLPSHAHETLERIDDHTIYERFNQLQSLDERLVSNTIRKLFRGPDKDVVICRTVLHDAAYPVDTATPTLVDDMAGWMVARPHPDAPSAMCRFTSVFQVPLEAHGASMSTPPTHYDMEEIISVLHTMSFVSSAQPTPRTTMHIQHAQTLDLTAISTPVPSMGTFLPRGKDFELAIKASLNAAIATAHAGARPRHPTQNPLRPGDLKHSNLK
ncbi:hypothetical protein H257_08041 [Aphanomyces astaci]|uniref:Uncharacterized protein n=1 Tax=Aphanomyces astaci TaxID=112090 RepID=W4GHV8_APHAT|nr:hypothetical protein H257_08041 [Aphanomyces astaci]ETV78528.1 hypothetical protein H257_08041 [Aphanomyces astaci]|eukprot:XP_009832109.1 hypothetical protein H257_08041 [Aphanomyces astaci]